MRPDAANAGLAVLNYVRRLSPRDRTILQKRIVWGTATLAQLGREFKVTRERVRQLEQRVKSDLTTFAKGAQGGDVRDVVAVLRTELGAAVPVAAIKGLVPAPLLAISPQADRETVFLTLMWLAGPYELANGTKDNWLVVSTDLLERIEALLEDERDKWGWISTVNVTKLLSQLGIRHSFQDAWLQAHGFFRVDDGWMRKLKSIRDTAEQILGHRRVPMTCTELNSLINGDTLTSRSARLLRRRLIRDGRFKRIADSLALRRP